LLHRRIPRQIVATLSTTRAPLNPSAPATLACRYAGHVAMKSGRVIAEGRPGDIVTPALVAEVSASLPHRVRSSFGDAHGRAGWKAPTEHLRKNTCLRPAAGIASQCKRLLSR
jgi:hypothetical protein